MTYTTVKVVKKYIDKKMFKKHKKEQHLIIILLFHIHSIFTTETFDAYCGFYWIKLLTMGFVNSGKIFC